MAMFEFGDTVLETGAIVSGTTRYEDTIPEMMYLLEEHNKRMAAKLTTEYSGDGWPYSMYGLGWGDPFDEVQAELAPDLYEDLVNAISDMAPDNIHFGASDVDPADLGFWEVEEEDW